MTKLRVGILGAGAGGLTLAKYLNTYPNVEVELFEKDNRVGGRCLSEPIDGHIVEYGTCYAIRAHRDALKWMKELKLETRRITKQKMDGAKLMDFVKSGTGPAFLYQAAKYVLLRRRLMKGVEAGKTAALAEASKSILQWLSEHNLGKVERLMYRVVTVLGYGFLNEVSTLQAMRWVDFDMFVTGLLDFTFMPVLGWQHFWDKLAEGMTVHLEHQAVRVDRSNPRRPAVTFADGTTATFDVLVSSLPVHQFAKIADATELEQEVAAGVNWGGYAMSLMSAREWFKDEDIQTWSDTSGRVNEYGRVFVARREIESADFNGMLYAIGQRVGDYSGAELEEILMSETIARGAVEPKLIRQKIWLYFPEYDREAVKAGLPVKMKAMQGHSNVYFTGAMFSHEAVSSICKFNRPLAEQIARQSPK